MPNPDSFYVVVYIIVFLCLVAAFPTPEEVKNMKAGQLVYTVLYRFFNQLCINARHIPGIGTVVQQVEQSESSRQANGTVTQFHKIETTASAPAPLAVEVPNESKG